jgi:ABC-type transporter Mla subunit MlaD
MDFEKNDVAAGAFVLGALLVFLLAFYAVNRGRLASRTYHLSLRLPEISGIEKGVEVVTKGYKAGSVDRVTIVYEPEFGFIVDLALRNEIRLREGTFAIARRKGFAGARFIELISPEGAKGPFLEEGAVLKTLPEPDLMAKAGEVMGEAQETLSRFKKGNLAEEAASALRAAQASFVELKTLLANTNSMVQENRAALKDSLEQTRLITARTQTILARQGEAVERVSKNLDQASAHLPAILSNVEDFTVEVKRRPWKLLRKSEPEDGKR